MNNRREPHDPESNHGARYMAIVPREIEGYRIRLIDMQNQRVPPKAGFFDFKPLLRSAQNMALSLHKILPILLLNMIFRLSNNRLEFLSDKIAEENIF